MAKREPLDVKTLELYRRQQQARDSELEAVRLELETLRRCTVLDAQQFQAQLTTERARAEEAERLRDKYRGALVMANATAARRGARLSAANARAGRLEESCRYVLTVHGLGKFDATPNLQLGSLRALRSVLSAAPQASTEQVSPSPAAGEDPWDADKVMARNLPRRADEVTNQDINTIAFVLNLAVDLGKLKTEARERILAGLAIDRETLAKTWNEGADCALTDVPALSDYEALLVEHFDKVMAQNPYREGPTK